MQNTGVGGRMISEAANFTWYRMAKKKENVEKEKNENQNQMRQSNVCWFGDGNQNHENNFFTGFRPSFLCACERDGEWKKIRQRNP